MTALQARLLAARSVRAAQAQEAFARRLRPGTGTGTDIPAQRSCDGDVAAPLVLVAGAGA
jgi:hypothetical protein